MKHLLPFSVYHEEGDDPGTVSDLRSMNADGLELLTSFSRPSNTFLGHVVGVHLPYAVDLMSGWEGTADVSGMSNDSIKYTFYGKDCDSVIGNVTDAITAASHLDPKYGVFHAGSVGLDDVFSGRMRHSDRDVLTAVAEIMNAVVSEFPGKEPPFKILFENLWWPGLRLLDDSGFRFLRDRLEFENWGICLDTGHLMIAAGGFPDDHEAVSGLERIFRTYSKEMVERIVTVHLHTSAGPPTELPSMPDDAQEMIAVAYGYVSRLDPHRPFTEKGITPVIGMLAPEFITHELVSPQGERSNEFMMQRSLFP